MLSKKALGSFKEIWRKEFKGDITDERATAEATALLTLFNAIYRPIRKDWLETSGDKK